MRIEFSWQVSFTVVLDIVLRASDTVLNISLKSKGFLLNGLMAWRGTGTAS
jgi:hypothetical protein